MGRVFLTRAQPVGTQPGLDSSPCAHQPGLARPYVPEYPPQHCGSEPRGLLSTARASRAGPDSDGVLR